MPTLLDELGRMLDGVEVTGTGSLASRLWTKPSAAVIGIDVPNVAEASNVLCFRDPARRRRRP